MVAFLVSAVALGIAFSAPPGAVSAEVWRRGLAGGFRPAFLVEAGSLVGDAVWAIVALLGAAVIVESAAGRITLGIVGATVLMTLALKALAAAYRPKRPPAGHIASGRGHFTTGAAISLTNPYAVAFWAGAGAGVSGVLADGGREDLGLFFAGFMLGALLWALFVSVLVGWAHRRTGPVSPAR